MAGGVQYIPEEFGKPKHWPHPRPHHRLPTDLEPAFVIGKDESCCPPTGDPCECVTSGDIQKWNFVYDNFSALTGINVSAINDVVDDVSALYSSAGLWNGTYETVSAHSAIWDTVPDLHVSAENHERRISNLEEFRDETVDDLNYIEDRLDNLHFDNDITNPYHSISGDGSSGAPFGVSDYYNLKNINDNYDELNRHIVRFSADGVNNELFEFDGAAYNVARIDKRLRDNDIVNQQQDLNIQRNYELICELAGNQKNYASKSDVSALQRDVSGLKLVYTDIQDDVEDIQNDIEDLQNDTSKLKKDVSGKQDTLKFGYNSSGYIVTINNSAIGGTGGGGGPVLTGDAQGALDQVYENSAIWLTAHQDLSDYATTAELDTNVEFILNEVATKLDASAFKPEKFYPMEGNPSGFLTAHQDLSNYATIDYVDNEIDDAYNELADLIDTKQRQLEAGEHIEIVSGESADIISVTGLNTFTYFSTPYGRHTSTEYFTFDGTKLSANSAIGYFNLSIDYKVNTNNTCVDNYYSAGVSVNDVIVDTHYINGNIPSESHTISKNIMNDAADGLYDIEISKEAGIDVNNINITCVGFMGEPDPTNIGVLGANDGEILTFGNYILRV